MGAHREQKPLPQQPEPPRQPYHAARNPAPRTEPQKTSTPFADLRLHEVAASARAQTAAQTIPRSEDRTRTPFPAARPAPRRAGTTNARQPDTPFTPRHDRGITPASRNVLKEALKAAGALEPRTPPAPQIPEPTLPHTGIPSPFSPPAPQAASITRKRQDITVNVNVRLVQDTAHQDRRGAGAVDGTTSPTEAHSPAPVLVPHLDLVEQPRDHSAPQDALRSPVAASSKQPAEHRAFAEAVAAAPNRPVADHPPSSSPPAPHEQVEHAAGSAWQQMVEEKKPPEIPEEVLRKLMTVERPT
jgi:hypothetical protein